MQTKWHNLQKGGDRRTIILEKLTFFTSVFEDINWQKLSRIQKISGAKSITLTSLTFVDHYTKQLPNAYSFPEHWKEYLPKLTKCWAKIQASTDIK